MHLIDTSVLVALLTDESHADWAETTLDQLRFSGGVFINQIVFSELCAGHEPENVLNTRLRGVVERADLPWTATASAGRAFRHYKQRGGKKNRMLPDFLIAAHADALGWTLVTNNSADVKDYFPNLKIICPDGAR